MRLREPELATEVMAEAFYNHIQVIYLTIIVLYCGQKLLGPFDYTSVD
jgi:hypothetical protein